MKKALSLILAVLICLSLCACGDMEDAQDTYAQSTTQEMPESTTRIITVKDYPGETGIKIGVAEKTLPEELFTMTGEENGLAGTCYLIEGEVIKTGELDGYPYFIVSTSGGDAWISDISEMTVEDYAGSSGLTFDLSQLAKFYPLPEVGETVCVFVEYQGMSVVTKHASFIYGNEDYLTNALLRSVLTNTDAEDETIDPEPIDIPVNMAPIETPTPTTTPIITTPETNQEALTAGPTAGESNALRTAQNYLNFMAFSYSGLIDQLKYEGYTDEEATYAADNCGADWNNQAIKSAKDYLGTSAFSYSGLIDQLVYEGFTSSQAPYGVDNCGADWFAQAAKSAADYISFMAFSRESLISQLEYEGFTHEQAVHGADSVGLK